MDQTKPDESSDDWEQEGKSVSEYISDVSAKICAVIILCIFPPIVILMDDDDDDEGAFMFGVSAIFYMLVDPLFLYVPLINEETKCVMLDNRLKIAAIVLRSCGDVRYVQRIYVRIKDGLQAHSLKKIAVSVGCVAIDTVCILPVPQVVILIFLPKMRGSRSLKIMKFLNSLILLQYLPRLYPIYKMCKKVNKYTVLNNKIVNLDIQIPKWFAIAVNIFGYIIASHVLGAFWYLFSIQRELDCFGYACRIENGCDFSTSCDKSIFRNITRLKNLCPINPPDATIFDFGIFLNALQSGMQASTNFPEKFLQCFLWGLRNLSSFASNLNTSTYGWENLFVVLIAIIGLILFMYLLGHTQTFMQTTSGSVWLHHKTMPQIHLMLSEYNLPYHMGSVIWRAVQDKLEDDKYYMENIYCLLPDKFKSDIKLHLFLPSLKKEPMDEELLKEICEHLEPMNFNGINYIIRQGEPLDMMFFVTQGTVLTYTINNGGSSSTSLLKKGDYYGEMLLSWAVAFTSFEFSNVPISPQTVKSQRKVEVFAITATELQIVVSKFYSKAESPRLTR